MSLLLALVEAGPSLPVPIMAERWALNSVPINGWDTKFGSGQAGMAITATGIGSKFANGVGYASMALSAVGNGVVHVYGVGSPADLILSATGIGKIIPIPRGTANLLLSATGQGRVALKGNGVAYIDLTASQSGNPIAAVGKGNADLSLSAEYGIPKTFNHSTYIDNLKSRVMRVISDERAMNVDPDIPMRVRQQGIMRLSRDRRN